MVAAESDIFRIPFCRQIDRIIDMAIDEDVGHGDITTEHLCLSGKHGMGVILARERVVLAGLELVEKVFQKIDPGLAVSFEYVDGETADDGAVVATISGSLSSLLIGERTALNFLQRMSGIATHVRQYADALKGAPVRLVDTRKTVPGWRVLDKYAVMVGGAHNHRMGLYDGVLIKDNHIAAVGGIAPAVDRIRKRVSHLVRIEVEAATISEVEEALAAGADIIMLDNMTNAEITDAVALVNGRALLEVSGRVDRGRIEFLAAAGIDLVSIGALTHSARFVDLSIDVSCRL